MRLHDGLAVGGDVAVLAKRVENEESPKDVMKVIKAGQDWPKFCQHQDLLAGSLDGNPVLCTWLNIPGDQGFSGWGFQQLKIELERGVWVHLRGRSILAVASASMDMNKQNIRCISCWPGSASTTLQLATWSNFGTTTCSTMSPKHECPTTWDSLRICCVYCDVQRNILCRWAQR